MKDLIATSRPVSWVNTAYPFAAAYLLAGGGIDWLLLLGTAFFLVPYNLAMYGINDVFDYESDLLNPRKGGVEGAVVPRARHRRILWASGIATVPIAAVLLASGGPAAAAALVVSLAAVVAYSAPGLRFKERPVVDSITSSTHFVSPAVYGWLLADGRLEQGPVAAFAAFFCWGMASHAFGAVQDILPDRAAHLGSVATIAGARVTVIASGALYAAAGILCLAVPAPGPLAGLLCVPYAVNALRFARLTDETSAAARSGWRVFLWLNYATGFLFTLLLLWTHVRSGF
ncbi:prenyltransferase [Zhihengliuella salsuginis]|uniref:Prenyltransferase n=1 Tax=Zhihengliuella salsuginis TaxID=578222 RepID=A0ABQ3GHC7_9MICC|nr:prenyltransferase [Zhihengliuella salsuginis]GHD04771.1 prenyltransferase [Zhihengliuella salsuginis]